MKKYKILIKETLEKEIEVNAEDEKTAYEIIENKYYNGDIVLTADDFDNNVEFIVREL